MKRMHRGRTLAALLLLAGAPAVALAQAKRSPAGSKELETCRSEVERLTKEKEALAKELTSLKASVVVDTDRKQRLAPVLDALAALRAVRSVSSAGSILDFKQYYLQAKVKVDGLPESKEAALLKPVLEAYDDANSLMLGSIGRDGLSQSTWNSVLSKYPGISIGQIAGTSHGRVFATNVRGGAAYLLDIGAERLKAVEEQLTHPTSLPEATPR
jgi:hypothetical protein